MLPLNACVVGRAFGGLTTMPSSGGLKLTSSPSVSPAPYPTAMDRTSWATTLALNLIESISPGFASTSLPAVRVIDGSHVGAASAVGGCGRRANTTAITSSVADGIDRLTRLRVAHGWMAAASGWVAMSSSSRGSRGAGRHGTPMV